MDGDKIDRLSVGVHRLRERVTRRGTLGVLLGGALAAVGVNADEADAKRRKRRKRKKKNCRGFGGRCNSNRHCCGGRCINGFCFPGGGGGGGGNGCCRGFPSDYRCCRFNGVDFCVQRNHPYCGDNGVCPIGWERCGGDFRCCGPDQQCCGNGRCCPDFGGWRCGDVACENWQDAEVGGESVETMPFEDPIAVDAED